MDTNRTARKRATTGVLVCLFGIGITAAFWWELWSGGGLAGGDTIYYFLPQKTYLVDHLERGEFPLWNNLVAHGYPLVGESQTALFYPTTLPIYLFLDANTGFNLNILIHYVAAFVFCWMYARRMGLSASSSCLVAIVFTYGWFPARMAVEWAITTGAWFPLALWAVESHLQSARARYLFLLAGILAIQLLAGHFALAFVTQLFLLLYAVLRMSFGRNLAVAPSRKKTLLSLFAAVCVAYPLAAVQLVPTLEFQHRSNRGELPIEDIEYGRLPPRFLGQMVAPWHYYSSDFDVNVEGEPQTNKIAGHLYVGLIPLALLLLGVFTRAFRGHSQLVWIWSALAAVALVYSFGWLIPITKYLPGFGYFKAPGLYTIVAALALALFIGFAYQRFESAFREASSKAVLFVLVIGLALCDFYLVSRMNTFVQIVKRSPNSAIPQSPIRKRLLAESSPPRVLIRGQNFASSLGFAIFPGYLGMTPAVYEKEETRLPLPVPYETAPTQKQIDWMQRAGITHIISLKKLDLNAWPATEFGHGLDPFIQGGLSHPRPIDVYALNGTRGRLSWDSPRPGDTAEITAYEANRVEAKVKSAEGGLLILTDLDFPGWSVSIDGKPVEGTPVDGMYRGVQVPAGEHVVTWHYLPNSVIVGAIVSGISLIAVVSIALFFRRRRLAARAD